MNIQATIKELEDQRSAIETAIQSLRALNGNVPHRPKRVAGTETVISAALAHLKKSGARQTSQQLRDAIHEAGVIAKPASIQTILSKRARRKLDLRHVGRGVWSLKK